MLNRARTAAIRRWSLPSMSRPTTLPECDGSALSLSAHRGIIGLGLQAPNGRGRGGRTIRWHGDSPGPDAPTVDVTFVNPDDTRTTVSARVGETLLQAAHRTGIEMEGACEGVCACSTCHVILEQELYDRVLEDTDDGAMGEDEEDMLDMAFGLSHTSRLGCQITLTEYMDGGVFTLPKATRNFYVDGHKPKPH